MINKIREVLEKSYKTVRIPTGESICGCKVINEIQEFDIDKAETEINKIIKNKEEYL